MLNTPEEFVDTPTDEDQKEAYEYYEVTKAFSTLKEKGDILKQSIKEQILSGYLNPLEFYRQAKLISDCIEELKKDAEILECANTEIRKYPKGKADINGSTIKLVSRDTPDYDSCCDPVYEELKEKMEARKKFLKNIPSTGAADPETGQILYPPVLKNIEYIQVELK